MLELSNILESCYQRKRKLRQWLALVQHPRYFVAIQHLLTVLVCQTGQTRADRKLLFELKETLL